MREKSILSLSVALLLLVASAHQAFAQKQQQKQLPAALNDTQVTERLNYLENALYAAQPHAQGWWYSWMAIYGSATIVQGTLAGHHWKDWKHDYRAYPRKIRNRAFAEDMLIGGCTTALGVGGLLITPFKSAYLPDKLRSMPASTAAERQAKLMQAEDILRQCAEVEADGWGWMPHVLNLVVNIGAGLTTVLAFNRPWTDGLITFGESEAVSLLNIFTQPRMNVKNLRNYEAKYKGGPKTGAYEEYETEVFFTLVPGGIGMGMKF